MKDQAEYKWVCVLKFDSFASNQHKTKTSRSTAAVWVYITGVFSAAVNHNILHSSSSIQCVYIVQHCKHVISCDSNEE